MPDAQGFGTTRQLPLALYTDVMDEMLHGENFSRLPAVRLLATDGYMMYWPPCAVVGTHGWPGVQSAVQSCGEPKLCPISCAATSTVCS